MSKDEPIILCFITLFSLAIIGVLFTIVSKSKELEQVCRFHTVQKIIMCDQNAKCRITDAKDQTAYVSFPVVGETREVCTYEYKE